MNVRHRLLHIGLSYVFSPDVYFLFEQEDEIRHEDEAKLVDRFKLRSCLVQLSFELDV